MKKVSQKNRASKNLLDAPKALVFLGALAFATELTIRAFIPADSERLFEKFRSQQAAIDDPREYELETALIKAERDATPGRLFRAWAGVKAAKWWLLACSVLLLLLQPFPSLTGYQADLLNLKEGLSRLVQLERDLGDSLIAARNRRVVAMVSNSTKGRILLSGCYSSGKVCMPVFSPTNSDVATGDQSNESSADSDSNSDVTNRSQGPDQNNAGGNKPSADASPEADGDNSTTGRIAPREEGVGGTPSLR